MGVRLVTYRKRFGELLELDKYMHNDLIGREEPDCHPIYAITGLQEILERLLDAMHTHNNKAVIDLFSRVNNVLYWNGKPVVEVSNDSGNVITWHADGLYAFAEYAHYYNTYSIQLVRTQIDTNNYRLEANLIPLDHEDNAIKIHPGGVFVNKYAYVETEDTKTGHLYQVGDGETLATMYGNGHVFAHQGTWANIANATEANAWYYDTSLGSFVQPLNTTSFTGFVSTIKYKTYVHRARLRSTDGDDDMNGLVIGYCIDGSGNPHTLTAFVGKGNNGDTPRYYLYYDYNLPDGQLVKSGQILNAYSYGGWSTVPNGVVMEVHKTGNLVEVQVSDWNSSTLNPNAVLSIDLNDYSWGYMFKGHVQYGYCNQSQASSFFTDIYFDGIGPLKCDVIISPDPGNMLEVHPNGLYARCDGGGGGGGGVSGSIDDIDDVGYAFMTLEDDQVNNWEVVTGDCISKFTTRSTNLEDASGNIVLKKGHKYFCNASLLGDYNSSSFYTVPECKITNNIGHKTSSYQSETAAFIEPEDEDVVLHLYVESKSKGTQFSSVSWISVHELSQNITINTGGGDCPVGQIMPYMGNYPPKHYLECDGSEYNIVDYPMLAEHFLAQYGTYNFFGGDGINTFCVPDLKDYDPQTFNSLKYFHCQDNKQLHEADDKLFLVQAEDAIEASIMYCIKYEMSVSQTNNQNTTENINIQQEIINTLMILNS